MKRQYPLYALIFTGGTVLMVLEIAGGRMLAPFFGSDIFVWGSIIGVFMVALALGYYIGGRISDRNPSETVLAGIAISAAVLMLALPAFGSWFCIRISESQLGARLGPFVAAFAIFTVPSVLLAMVSPFGVKLAASRLEKVGNVAGSLYSLSTVGSILGTIATAFLLIPITGTRMIVYMAGAVELAVGILLFVTSGGLGKAKGPATLGILLVLALAFGIGAYPSGPGVPVTMKWDRYVDETGKVVTLEQELKYWTESSYHLIMVTEQMSFDIDGKERKRRLLRFNDRTESAIFIDNLDATGKPKVYQSAVSYTALLHMGVLFKPEAKTALFVGIGGGIGPMEFHDHYGMQVDAVDVDPEVVRVAEEWFYLAPSDALKVHVSDGRRFLARSDRKYDIIILDAYSSGGSIPWHLVTRQFYELVKRHLAPDGVMVSNLISALDGKGSGIFKSAYKTMYAAGFENVYVFPRFSLPGEKMRQTPKDDYFRDRGMNIITVATQDRKRMSGEELTASARQIMLRAEHSAKLPHLDQYAAFLHRMPYAEREDVLKNMDGVVFTDDYAPTDTMYAGF